MESINLPSNQHLQQRAYGIAERVCACVCVRDCVWVCAGMYQEMEKLIRPEVLIKAWPWDRTGVGRGGGRGQSEEKRVDEWGGEGGQIWHCDWLKGSGRLCLAYFLNNMTNLDGFNFFKDESCPILPILSLLAQNQQRSNANEYNKWMHPSFIIQNCDIRK